MTDSHAPEPAFRDLVNAVCCEALTPDEAVLLEQKLLAGEQARKEYFQACELTVEIWIALGASRAARQAIDRSAQTLLATDANSAPIAAEKPGSPVLGFLRSTIRGLPGGEFTVGSLVMLAVVAAFATLSNNRQWVTGAGSLPTATASSSRDARPAANRDAPAAATREPAIAVMSATADAIVVASDAREISPMRSAGGAPVRIPANSRVHVRKGVAELRFSNGVELAVQGPAELQPTSEFNVRLNSGQLVALVPHEFRGFTVQTPVAAVVDLGTEFGVRAGSDGQTEVSVFKGIVEVLPGDRAKRTLRFDRAVRLRAGESLRVDAEGTIFQVPSAGQSTASNERPVRAFAGVRRYLDLADVVAGGNGEDVKDGGIDPRTGEIITAFVPFDNYQVDSDGKYHPVKGSRWIDGFFIPVASGGPVQLDSTGNIYKAFGQTVGRTYGPIWAGSKMPLGYFDTRMDLDYGNAGHRMIAMHASVGITFKIAELVAQFENFEAAMFTSRVGNPTWPEGANNPNHAFDVWVFVDGQLRYSKRKVYTGSFAVNVPLGPGDQLLTIVSTDGGDTHDGDRVLLGDPQIVLCSRAHPNSKRGAENKPTAD